MKRLFAISCLTAILAACDSGETPPTPEPTPTESPTAETTGLLLPLPEDTTPEITPKDRPTRFKIRGFDTFAGRGPGTDAGDAAADWIAAELDRLGLKPGVDGSWFQTVEMVNQTLDEDQSYLTISTDPEAEPLPIKEKAVFWTKHQDELDLSFADSDVIFVGYGIVAPEYGWNDYEGLDVEGKTVVMLVNDPGFATQDPDLFKGNAMTYYGRWTYKYEEAARQGATAAIVVHETAPAAYGWDVVANSWTGSQGDLVRNTAGADRALLEGWVTYDTAVELFREAGLDYDALKKEAEMPGFKAVDMGDLVASGRVVQTVEKATSRNVIGIIEGTEVPDEYVMYSAHWDHLGNAEDPTDTKSFTFQEDKIYNGAVDNGTGVSAALDIAEAMASEKPKRSVMFAFVTLEESGLLGSAYLAENPVIPHAQIVAGINIDALQPLGPAHDMIVVGYGASELEDILTEILAEDDRVIKPDPSPQNGYFYRSDHISWAKKGVPMLYADSGDDLIEGGKEAGEALLQEYTALRYHKPQDEYNEDWNLEGTAQDVQALHDLGLEIADSADWPTWYEGNEFKAIREADLAAHDSTE